MGWLYQDVSLGFAEAERRRLHKPSPVVFTPVKRTSRKRELTADDRCYNRAFASVRIVVEMTLNRMRRYQSLSQRDRHHRQRHTERVEAITGLVNRQFDSRFPKQ